jgi:hypothetical protein
VQVQPLPAVTHVYTRHDKVTQLTALPHSMRAVQSGDLPSKEG